MKLLKPARRLETNRLLSKCSNGTGIALPKNVLISSVLQVTASSKVRYPVPLDIYSSLHSQPLHSRLDFSIILLSSHICILMDPSTHTIKYTVSPPQEHIQGDQQLRLPCLFQRVSAARATILGWRNRRPRTSGAHACRARACVSTKEVDVRGSGPTVNVPPTRCYVRGRTQLCPFWS